MKDEFYSPIVVYKGRTTEVIVNLGFDVSADTFSSQIRSEDDVTSTLIATWAISFVTDGTDGLLLLKLDNSVTSTITRTKGFMDIKRITSGEPIPVFDKPLPVIIQSTVTE